MRSDEKSLLLYWFLVPPILASALLITAMAMLLQYAFREYIPGSIEVGGFTLDNFARAAKWLYVRVFLDSFQYAALTAVVSLTLAYPLAYLLVRSPSALLRSAILIISISPLFTGDVVRSYAWLVVLGRNGFLNSTLLYLGVIEQPLDILYTPLAVVIALVQHAMPVMVIILTAAIGHIDVTYERAAASLGASPLWVFLRVTLPLSAPGIIAGSITIFAWTLSAFATPQLVGGGRVSMIANMVYNMGFANFDFPFAAVLSLVALILTIGLLTIVRKISAKYEDIGSH